MSQVIELRKQMNKLLHDARKYWTDVQERAQKEGRAPSGDEVDQFDRMLDEVAEMEKHIQQAEEIEQRSIKLDSLMKRLDEPLPRRTQPDPLRHDDKADTVPQEMRSTSPVASNEYRTAFAEYLRVGLRGMGEQEYRALQVANPQQGGYLVASEQFVAELIKGIDDEVHIRRFATTFRVDRAQSLGAPSLEADPADPDWTTEIATISEDTAMQVGKRELHPHPVAKALRVSRPMLQQSLFDVERLVRERLVYKMSIVQEKGFLTGNGVQQPLGLFVASGDGIDTSRDVTTANAGSITYADMVATRFALKTQYLTRARWLMNRDTFAEIMKLVSTTGEPIFRESAIASEPARILGSEFLLSEYAPNWSTTSGAYLLLFGDLSWYWIADAMDVEVQRLDEIAARNNQVEFHVRASTDGMPVLAEAFARLKMQ